MITCNDPYAAENDGLEKAIVAYSGKSPVRAKLNTGHAYSDQRPALANAVTDWLRRCQRQIEMSASLPDRNVRF
jgi:hypothetical protein